MTETREYLDTKSAVRYVNQLGFPLSIKTMQSMICRGGGPKFQHFGRRVLYRRENIDLWLSEKMSPLKTNSLDKGGYNG